MSFRYRQAIILVFLLLLLTACNRGGGLSTLTPAECCTPTAGALAASDTPSPTATPTATPVPLAARVNGEAITLADFLAEVSRYQAAAQATGTEIATDASSLVLNELIDQLLLSQGARENGFVVDEAVLQARIDALASQLGSTQALDTWAAQHGYAELDFRMALSRAVEAAWMRDTIAAAVPETADQVHVRQILLYNSEEANQVVASLQAGTDFEQLAESYDPVTGGELGWFPMGYLSEPAIEAAAFALQPGQYSPVIETGVGFHILQLIERDPQRFLEPDARQVLQLKALQDWLETRRSQSTIENMLP